MRTVELPIEEMLPRVIYAREFELEKRKRVKPKRITNSYELGFYLGGNGCIYVEEEEFPVHYGDVRFTRPGTSLYSRPQYRCYTLVFDFGEHDVLCRNSILDHIPSWFPTDGKCGKLFEEIIRSFSSNDGAEKLRCNALVMQLLYELYKNSSCGSSYSNAVRACMGYMEEHLDQHITLKTLEAVSGYSHIHTMRLFREETGQTPKEWLTGLRISRAKTLLSEGERSIDEVADLCGFRSCSHFKVLFKEVTGFTPGEYRKQMSQIF